MTIKFYLKRPAPGKRAVRIAKEKGNTLPKFDADTPTSVFAFVSYDGNVVKIYTGESIPPKFWNPDTQCARTTPKFTESPEFNQRLNNIRSDINRVFLDYRNRNGHATPAPAVLKPLINEALKKGVAAHTFLSYFEGFVQRSLTGQRINHKSKKPIRFGVAKGYKTTLNHLKEFSKTWSRTLDFATVDLDFHNDFTAYLSASPRLHSPNTIGSNFQRIKAVMAEATDSKINSNEIYKHPRFSKQSEEAETIYLDTKELKAMQRLDLKGNNRLDNVRDLFLIGAYTGLRFSDFSILKPDKISGGFIRINQVKTGKPVIIPVHSVVRSILKKRKGETPRTISNVKMNLYLKEIGKMIPALQKQQSKTITKGGLGVTRTFQKWELLTTHTARRSFATNEYKAGMPTLTIMGVTGHRTEQSFFKYIRITPEDHAVIMARKWEEREQPKLKAV